MRAWSIGRMAGIPVRLHGSLLLFLPLLAWSFVPPGTGWVGVAWGCVYAVALFASIVLHELGHSLVARRQGSVILDILLLPIGGMARIVGMSPRPRDEFAVAAAGPAVSLVLGGPGWLSAPYLFGLNPWLGIVADSLGRMNLWLGLFNLIPAYPMDGGRIFRALLSPRLGPVRATRIAANVARVVAVLFAVRAVWPWFHGGQVRIFLLLIALFVWQSAAAELRRTGAAASPPPPFP
jgi:Zn-dependent protease